MQATAGQRRHEELFGAILRIFNRDIPCSHAPVRDDFVLGPGGLSPALTVKSITFRRELIGNAVPAKGTVVTLTTANKQRYDLKLWSGGILADGEIYDFMAVAADYKA